MRWWRRRNPVTRVLLALIGAAFVAWATYLWVNPPTGEFYGYNRDRRSLMLVLPYLAAYAIGLALVVLAAEYAVRSLRSRFANRLPNPPS